MSNRKTEKICQSQTMFYGSHNNPILKLYSFRRCRDQLCHKAHHDRINRIHIKVLHVVKLNTLYQVYIPVELRQSLGRFKTCKRLQAPAYWRSLSVELKRYDQNCQTCQFYKPECRRRLENVNRPSSAIPRKCWEWTWMGLIW